MTATDPNPAPRLASADAYRGFVMLLMMAEALSISKVAKQFPDSPTWQFLGFHTSHVEWVGGSLHDMIQPSFSFLVGVALPYSIASRLGRGQMPTVMFGHALWRSVVLIGLGIFLRSVGRTQTLWEFTDTLCQIGLGYPFLFLLGLARPSVRWLAFFGILVGYWLLFALYPASGETLASHWAKNANVASTFDRWFLNLFPRAEPFEASGGGYATLSFIPTLATMTLGLIAGDWLRRDWAPGQKIAYMMSAGIVGIAAGDALNRFGVCPLVKRIWTPSWTLWSGGVCLMILATLYAAIDVVKQRWWAFALIVVGMNSIAMYCLSHLIDEFISGTLTTHFGTEVFKVFGEVYEPIVRGTAVVAVLWLIALWMYRRRLFLRV